MTPVLVWKFYDARALQLVLDLVVGGLEVVGGVLPGEAAEPVPLLVVVGEAQRHGVQRWYAGRMTGAELRPAVE